MSLLLAIPNKYTNTMSSTIHNINGLSDRIQRQNLSKVSQLCVDPESHTVYIKDDDQALKSRIKQVMELTNKSSDEVAVALHDADNDVNKAVNILLEAPSESLHQNEWKVTSSRKKKSPQPPCEVINDGIIKNKNNDNSAYKKPNRTIESSKFLSHKSKNINLNDEKEETWTSDQFFASNDKMNNENSEQTHSYNNEKFQEPKDGKFEKKNLIYKNTKSKYSIKSNNMDQREDLDLANNEEKNIKGKNGVSIMTDELNKNQLDSDPNKNNKFTIKPSYSNQANTYRKPAFDASTFNRTKNNVGTTNRYSKYNEEKRDYPPRHTSNSFGSKDQKYHSKTYSPQNDNKAPRDSSFNKRGMFYNKYTRGNYNGANNSFRGRVIEENQNLPRLNTSPNRAKIYDKQPSTIISEWDKNDNDLVANLDTKPFWNKESFGEWVDVGNKQKNQAKETSKDDGLWKSPPHPPISNWDTDENTVSKSIDISELLGSSASVPKSSNVKEGLKYDSNMLSETNRQASEAIKNAIGVGLQSPSPQKSHSTATHQNERDLKSKVRRTLEISEFGQEHKSATMTSTTTIKSKLPPLSKIPNIPVVMPDNHLPSSQQNFQFGTEDMTFDGMGSFDDIEHDIRASSHKGSLSPPKKHQFFKEPVGQDYIDDESVVVTHGSAAQFNKYKNVHPKLAPQNLHKGSPAKSISQDTDASHIHKDLKGGFPEGSGTASVGLDPNHRRTTSFSRNNAAPNNTAASCNNNTNSNNRSSQTNQAYRGGLPTETSKPPSESKWRSSAQPRNDPSTSVGTGGNYNNSNNRQGLTHGRDYRTSGGGSVRTSTSSNSRDNAYYGGRGRAGGEHRFNNQHASHHNPPLLQQSHRREERPDEGADIGVEAGEDEPSSPPFVPPAMLSPVKGSGGGAGYQQQHSSHVNHRSVAQGQDVSGINRHHSPQKPADHGSLMKSESGLSQQTDGHTTNNADPAVASVTSNLPMTFMSMLNANNTNNANNNHRTSPPAASTLSTVPTPVNLQPSVVSTVGQQGLQINSNINDSNKTTPVPLAAASLPNYNRLPANFSPAFTPLLNHQYALGQALGLPYFPPPMYTYEDLQLLQRFPMAGFYDLSSQLSAAAAATAFQQQQAAAVAAAALPLSSIPVASIHQATNSAQAGQVAAQAQSGVSYPLYHQHHQQLSSNQQQLHMMPPHNATGVVAQSPYLQANTGGLGSQSAQPAYPYIYNAAVVPNSAAAVNNMALQNPNAANLANNNGAGGNSSNSNNLLMMNHILPGMMNSLFVGSGVAGGVPNRADVKGCLSTGNAIPSPLLQLETMMSNVGAVAPQVKYGGGPVQGSSSQGNIGNVGGDGGKQLQQQQRRNQQQQQQQMIQHQQNSSPSDPHAEYMAAVLQQQSQQQPPNLSYLGSTNPAFATGMGYYYPSGLIPGAIPQYPLAAVFPAVNAQASNPMSQYQKANNIQGNVYSGNYNTGEGQGTNEGGNRNIQKQNMPIGGGGGNASMSKAYTSGKSSTVSNYNNNSLASTSNNAGPSSRMSASGAAVVAAANYNDESGNGAPMTQSGSTTSHLMMDKQQQQPYDKNIGSLNPFDILAALQQQQQQQQQSGDDGSTGAGAAIVLPAEKSAGANKFQSFGGGGGSAKAQQHNSGSYGAGGNNDPTYANNRKHGLSSSTSQPQQQSSPIQNVGQNNPSGGAGYYGRGSGGYGQQNNNPQQQHYHYSNQAPIAQQHQNNVGGQGANNFHHRVGPATAMSNGPPPMEGATGLSSLHVNAGNGGGGGANANQGHGMTPKGQQYHQPQPQNMTAATHGYWN